MSQMILDKKCAPWSNRSGKHFILYLNPYDLLQFSERSYKKEAFVFPVFMEEFGHSTVTKSLVIQQ